MIRLFPVRAGKRSPSGHEVTAASPNLAGAANTEPEAQVEAPAPRGVDDVPAKPAPQPRSLFGEILDWMLAPLLVVWPMSIAATYLVAASIANAPFDRALEDSATVLAQQVKLINGHTRLVLPIPARDILRADDTDHIYYQVLGNAGETVGGDPEMPYPHDDDPPASGIVQYRNDIIRGEEVRVAYIYLENRPGLPGDTAATGRNRPLVQVAETLGKRSHLANEIIKGVILPQFVILPIAVILVWFGLSRGLRPLSRLQQRIQARSAEDMRPIDPREAPEEVAPLVASFNQLLARLEHHIDDQKRFIADAAHQMRTPLAGLRTQAELALRETNPQELHRSLEQLATGSVRATRLINQLLALARTENRHDAHRRFEPVDLETMARDVVRDWVPAALEKRIDLGFEGIAEPVFVSGNTVLLRELLKNLIDNAIRYTHNGGSVTVRVGADPVTANAILEVEDNGPGIPDNERHMVFERFYRVLGSGADGSGLGLAIVREIALQHGATIESANASAPAPALKPAEGGRYPGTSMRVVFPLLARPVGDHDL